MEVDKSDQDWNTDGKKGRSSFNANLEPVIPRADLVLFQDTHNEQRGQNRGGLFSGRGGRGRGRGFRGQRVQVNHTKEMEMKIGMNLQIMSKD
ncbi:MAG: hypothetical protein EZS28_011675 [Streblomastix strix]|uniref:Uncharacterized protein n=1 Tax=Streblomastix strix TaxID=222440 RepID=A0A5J4WCV6_9EUKA|nr:MAG: hypothetical protein EZS28_011675 [Streblomastix strix]